MNPTFSVGIDVGGTKIAAGLVGPDGEVHGAHRVPTPAGDGPAAILDAMATAARPALEALEALDGTARPDGVGVGTGGVIDHRTGRVVSSTDLLSGWTGFPVGDELRKRLDLPVRVDNDANALALGELRFGAAAGLDSVLFVAVGTGIGGALVLDGSLVHGASHAAGELGHLPAPGQVDARERICSCGRPGHLEAVASGPAITRTHRIRGGQPVTDLRDVAVAALDGDDIATAALNDGAAALGSSLGGLVNTLGPQAVVVGGGVAQIGDAYWRPMENALRSQLLPACEGVAVYLSQLGADAAVVGAAALWL